MTQFSPTNSEVDDKSTRDNETSYTESLAASSYVADDMSEKTIPATAPARVATLSPSATTLSSVAPAIALPPSRNFVDYRPVPPSTNFVDYRQVTPSTNVQDFRQAWECGPPVTANRARGGGFAQPRILRSINDTPPPKEDKFEPDDFSQWIYPASPKVPYPESERSMQVRSPAYYPPYPPPIQPQQPSDPWGVNKPAGNRIPGQPWKTENRKPFSSWCKEETVPQYRGPFRPDHITIRPSETPAWPPSPELPPKKETNRDSFDDARFLKDWGVPGRDQPPRRKNLQFKDESVDNDYDDDRSRDDNRETNGGWEKPIRGAPSPSPIRAGNSRPEGGKGFFIPPIFGNPKGYYLNFHKLLLPGADKLDWDVTKSPHDSAYCLNGSHVEPLPFHMTSLPATQPPMKAICLILDEANRFVRVETCGRDSFVTISEVLWRIYDEFSAPIAPHEWFDLADNKYPYRMKAIATKKRAEMRQNPRASLKWADMLEGKVYFGGIVDFEEKPIHGGDLPTFTVHFEE